MQIINSADRRPKENPGASLKHTAWSISFNHQPKLLEIEYTQSILGGDEICEFIKSLSSFPFLPTSHSPCICALQALSCPGEGEGKGRLVLL